MNIKYLIFFNNDAYIYDDELTLDELCIKYPNCIIFETILPAKDISKEHIKLLKNEINKIKRYKFELCS